MDQLKKLSERVGTGETTLYVTDQVRAEFARNRDSAIDEALDVVRKAPSLPNRFPHLFETLDGYDDVRAALTDAGKKLRALQDEAAKAVESGSLHADALINDLFAKGRSIGLSGSILEAAKLRVLLGNPPGKPGSYGDAVHWESLLVEVPDREDLVLVSDDRDFRSKLDSKMLHAYLSAEWSEAKHSQVHLHGSLRSALEAYYPEIKLVPEPVPEQEDAVERLVQATNFAATHSAIRRLLRYEEFTADQVAALVEAADENSQVGGIMQDDDVFAFFDGLSRQYGSIMESSLFDRLNDRLKDAEAYRERLA